MKTKSRSKIIKRRRNIVGAISAILIFGGIIFLMGIEGGVKADTIELRKAIVMSIVGLACVGLGAFGVNILEETKSVKKH